MQTDRRFQLNICAELFGAAGHCCKDWRNDQKEISSTSWAGYTLPSCEPAPQNTSASRTGPTRGAESVASSASSPHQRINPVGKGAAI